ncbi:MAG: hypothetical protein AB7V13_29540 [Pseudorhodoplanes sp.]|uniref:hypothetical protein n=1 Tax=Pseudorhodoplanes sp. TaxID=1934341 RepID=UPI003D0E360E
MEPKRIAYRRARNYLFGEQALSRQEKIKAARHARLRIRSSDNDDPVVLANAAISDARQQLQIERSAHALGRSRSSF